MFFIFGILPILSMQAVPVTDDHINNLIDLCLQSFLNTQCLSSPYPTISITHKYVLITDISKLDMTLEISDIETHISCLNKEDNYEIGLYVWPPRNEILTA